MSRPRSVLTALALGAALSAASDLTLDGSNQWILHTPDDGRQDLFVGRWLGKSWDWPYTLKADGTLCTRSLYANGNINIEAWKMLYSNGRMQIHGEELLVLLNKKGVVVSKAWGGAGDLSADGNLNTQGHVWAKNAVYTNGNVDATCDVWGRNVGARGDLSAANNLVLGGSNSWIIHTPDDGRASLHIAPKVNGAWDWGKGFSMDNGILKAPMVQAARLLVTASWWADTVFADNYKLLPLPEVKAYIAEHRHLPGVPSEAVIKADGVQVSDMLAVQMTKIEELTLHVISQQETITRLESTNTMLLERLSRLEAAVGSAPIPHK